MLHSIQIISTRTILQRMKKKQIIKITLYFLLIVSLMAVLLSPFAIHNGIEHGMVMGKVYWFHLSLVWLAVVFFLFSIHTPCPIYTPSRADYWLFLFALTTLFTYSWSLNPEPDKFIFGVSLLIAWYLFRLLLISTKMLPFIASILFILVGLAQAVLGTMQLHGWSLSNHSMFRLTGSFYNPGPYAGYLAMSMPMLLYYFLRSKSQWQSGLTATGILLLLIVLPASMSRTAWIASAIACGWVYWATCIGWKQTKQLFLRHKKKSIALSIAAILLLGAGAVGLYHLKSDSANGRLLLWKITAKAACHKPLVGVGLGGFSAAYAAEQAAYFRTADATEAERYVAGAPEYAFNEYLQIALEQGFVGLFYFICFLIACLYAAIRNKRFGIAGALIALMVFSFASYPLQLPSFWIALMLLGAIAVTPRDDENWEFITLRSKVYSIQLVHIFFICIATIMLIHVQKDRYKAYESWKSLTLYHSYKGDSSVLKEYQALAPSLSHKSKFLFQWGQRLAEDKQYAAANVQLTRAMQLSSDPMIHYVIAKNKQLLGEYDKAEETLLHAIDILPERIYPWYLLCKLYADENYRQPDKFEHAAQRVLTQKPKVMSTAIKEMREEVKVMQLNMKKNTIKNKEK